MMLSIVLLITILNVNSLNSQYIDTKRLLEIQAKAANLQFPCGPIRYNYSLQHNQTTVDNLIAIYNCSSLNININPDILNNTYDLFNNNFYITDLILSNNQLKSFIYSDRINFYDSLRLLDLSDNLLNENITLDLNKLDCNLLDYFKFLTLKNNRFTRVPILSVACMHQLESIDLSYNRLITNIDHIDSLGQTYARLRILDLSYCSIESLPNKTQLINMPSLQVLNLANNLIKLIEPNPFLSLAMLRLLDLDSNLLKCDVNLLWFKAFLIGKQLNWLQNETIIYRPVCFNELTNRNESIVDLEDSLFYSPIQIISQQTNEIYALEGTNINIECSIFSRPESLIWWLYNNLNLEFSSDKSFFRIDETSTSQFNKTSKLSLFNVTSKSNGNYTCRAYYKLNSSTIDMTLSKSLTFRLSVAPKPETGKLSAAELAGIIVGSVIGLLLILFLLFIIIYFICYKRRLLCFKNTNNKLKSTSTKYLNNSTSATSSRRNFDFDDDEYNTNEKPNYIINTISKANNAYLNDNLQQEQQQQQLDFDDNDQFDSIQPPQRINNDNVDSQFYFSNNANFAKYQQSSINKSMLYQPQQQQYMSNFIRYDSDV